MEADRACNPKRRSQVPSFRLLLVLDKPLLGGLTMEIHLCSISSCEEKHYAKGFCKKHHQFRWKRGLLPPDKSVEWHFWDRTDKCGEDECWEWKASVDGNGYGNFSRGGDKSHRYSYSLLVGPIPLSLHVLHKCNNRKCVNPKHLYVGTHQQNMQDMAASGIQKGANAKITGTNLG